VTEKEKSHLGLLYDANFDKTLLRERYRCQRLCHFTNAFYPFKMIHKWLLRKILPNLGSDFVIEHGFQCVYGDNVTIGDHFFANNNLILIDTAKIVFGNYVFIAPNCGFYTAGHPFHVEQRNKGLEYAFPITVGDNVWFGGNVCVMPGVTIGNNVVIGAGSVVTRDIPSGALAYGNPCKVKRILDPEEIIEYRGWKATTQE